MIKSTQKSQLTAMKYLAKIKPSKYKLFIRRYKGLYFHHIVVILKERKGYLFDKWENIAKVKHMFRRMKNVKRKIYL